MITEFQIFESNTNKCWFYHATKPKYLLSIIKNGLLPNDDRPTNWKTEPELSWSRGKVFVTESFSDADDYGYDINNCWNKLKWYPILRIKMNPKELEKDYDLDNDWYSRKPIRGEFEIFIRFPNNNIEKNIPSDKEWKKLTPELIKKL